MPTSLQQRLKLELPIIQAPMAGVQDSALTLAVSNAGGLGSLPCAMLSTAQIRAELQTIREHTDKAYNVNFFCHSPPEADEQRENEWRAARVRHRRRQSNRRTAAQPFRSRSAGAVAGVQATGGQFSLRFAGAGITGCHQGDGVRNPVQRVYAFRLGQQTRVGVWNVSRCRNHYAG